MAEHNTARGPYFDTTIAKLLRDRYVVHPEITDHQIAQYLGYDHDAIIGMFRDGQTKLPLDKVARVAEVLNADPIALTRAALEQFGLHRDDAMGRLFERIATDNEQALLGAYRNAVGGSDFQLPRETIEAIRSLIADAYQRTTVDPTG
jgi:hypothetical protein